MVQRSNDWRLLCMCDNPRRARTIATTLWAMEYDARLRCGVTARPMFHDDDAPEGPIGVEVPAEHWHDLTEILDSLLAEQDEFDASVEHHKILRSTAYRLVIGAGGVLVVVAAVRWLSATR